jgi:hypothetical protein
MFALAACANMQAINKPVESASSAPEALIETKADEFASLATLWRNYNQASLALEAAMGRTANMVGEFAERLVAQHYNVDLSTSSAESLDLITADNKRIQVKARKLQQIEATRLSIIRSWDFDLLVVVLFGEDGNILKAIEIDSNSAKELARFDEYQNGYVLTTSKKLLEHEAARDITQNLQNIMDGMADN